MKKDEKKMKESVSPSEPQENGKRIGKKKIILIACVAVAILALIAGIVVLIVSSNGKKEEKVEETVVDGAIVLSQTTATLDVNEELRLVYTTSLEGTAKWTTTDSQVATVSQKGTVTAKGVGNCDVAVSIGQSQAICTVKVFNSYLAPVISVRSEQIEIGKGDIYTVEPVVWYKGEEHTDDMTMEYTLQENGASIVQLDKDGNSAILKGLDFGTVTCVVSTSYNDVLISKSLQITVKEVGMVFDVSNLQPSESGYSLSLDTLTWAEENYNSKFKPVVKVYHGGSLVNDATIEYMSNDVTKVRIDDVTKEIIAVSEGKTTVEGSYGGKSFTIAVEVKKPTREVRIENLSKLSEKENPAVEVGDLKPLIFNETLRGTFIKATLDGNEVASDTSEIELDKTELEKLPFSAYGVGKTLIIETEQLLYLTKIDLYTLVIDNATEYARIGELSKATNENANIWGGYFVLGSNFEATDMVEFIDRSKTTIKTDGSEGFAGIIDGRGHYISGLTKATATGNAFVSVLHRDGVIKNIAFKNAKFKGENGSFLCQMGRGKIEDVYISYAEITNSGSWSGTLMNCATSVSRVVVDASQATISGDGTKFKLLSCALSSLTIENGSYFCLYPSGYDGKQVDDNSGSSINNAVVGGRAFSDWGNLKANSLFASVKTWNVDFWYVNQETGQVIAKSCK